MTNSVCIRKKLKVNSWRKDSLPRALRRDLQQDSFSRDSPVLSAGCCKPSSRVLLWLAFSVGILQSRSGSWSLRSQRYWCLGVTWCSARMEPSSAHGTISALNCWAVCLSFQFLYHLLGGYYLLLVALVAGVKDSMDKVPTFLEAVSRVIFSDLRRLHAKHSCYAVWEVKRWRRPDSLYIFSFTIKLCVHMIYV